VLNTDPFKPNATIPDSFVAPAQTPRSAPAIARMRIFFAGKQSWLSWLTRPIRILLISTTALILLVVIIAFTATRTSGKLATASDIGETLSGLAVRDGADNSAAEGGGKDSRQETRNSRETRRTNSGRQPPPKKPSVFSRAKNKLKKIFKF
jgi:hypothetical protein